MFTINCLLIFSVKVSEYCVFLDVIVFDGCLIKRVKVMFVRSYGFFGFLKVVNLI
jgi:hypothetical protein